VQKEILPGEVDVKALLAGNALLNFDGLYLKPNLIKKGRKEG